MGLRTAYPRLSCGEPWGRLGEVHCGVAAVQCSSRSASDGAAGQDRPAQPSIFLPPGGFSSTTAAQGRVNRQAAKVAERGVRVNGRGVDFETEPWGSEGRIYASGRFRATFTFSKRGSLTNCHWRDPNECIDNNRSAVEV
jgi:hypothetical protein